VPDSKHQQDINILARTPSLITGQALADQEKGLENGQGGGSLAELQEEKELESEFP